MELDAPLKEQLYLMEERLLNPEARRSAEELDLLLADDFVEFGSSGRIYYKPQVISALQHAPSERMTIKNFQIKILAQDIVLTTFRLVKHNEPNEKMRITLRSSIWQLIDGRWQMVFHQGTPAKEPEGIKNNFA